MFEIRKRIIKNILFYAGNSNYTDITDNTNLIIDLDYDSLALVQLVVVFENEFNIVFDSEMFDFEKITRFGMLEQMIIDLIEQKTQTIKENENVE